MKSTHRLRRLVMASLLGAATLSAAPADVRAGAWVDLLDAKLSRCELWMGVPHESVRVLPLGTPTSADPRTRTPLGLGLETKWGQKIWEPRLRKPRDAGLVFHCTGPQSAFWNVWTSCLAFQIQENDIGNPYLVTGISVEATTAASADEFRAFSPIGERISAGTRLDSRSGMIHRSANHARPGDSNSVELYTVGDRAVLLVNSRVVNALVAAQVARAADLAPLTPGKLQIQSESAEAFSRHVPVRPLAAFPSEIAADAGFDS